MANRPAVELAEPRPGRTARRSWPRRALLAAAIALPWGLVAGLLLAHRFHLPWPMRPTPTAHPTPSPNPAPESAIPHAATASPHAATAGREALPTAVEPLRQADGLLLRGNYADATARYQQLVAQEDLPSASLVYRLAIGCELSGDHARALDLYQQLARPDLGLAIQGAAVLGQARIHLAAGRYDLAEPFLAGALLELAAAVNPSSLLAGDISHLYAQTQARRLLREKQTDLLAPEGLATAEPQWAPDHLLDLLESDLLETPAAAPQPLELVLRFGDSPTDVQVRGQLGEQSVAQLVASLAELLELNVQTSPATAQLLASRRGTFSATSLSGGMALDALLGPLGLTWEVTSGGQLRIEPFQQIDHGQEHRRRLEAAQRSLQAAVTSFPENQLAPLSLLLLANLNAWTSQWDVALAWYHQAQAQYPQSPYRAELWFNQGKVYLLVQQPSAAREAFYHVVDGARGHLLEGVSYVYLGRLFLDQGETELAARPLLRAVAITRPPVQAVAATSLASAYLLADNPHAASLTLSEYAPALRGSDHHTAAAFLGSLARFQAGSPNGHQVLAGRELIATAAHVRPDHFFGDYGVLLVGQGFRQLGLLESLIQLYEQALAAGQPLTAAVEGRLRLELAEAYDLLGQPESAQTHLERLAEFQQEEWSYEGQLRLVELRYRQGDASWCLQRCQELLDELPEEDARSRLLRVMGRIYEDQRDHFRAALCYAGLLPGKGEWPSEDGGTIRDIP